MTVKEDSASHEGLRNTCTSRTLRAVMRMLICAGCLVAPSASHGAELTDETLRTWDAYLQAANLQMGSQTPFLWADQLPERLQRVRGGEILVS